MCSRSTFSVPASGFPPPRAALRRDLAEPLAKAGTWKWELGSGNDWMELTVLNTAAQVGLALADRVTQLIHERPAAVLGLPTGQTPLGAYAELRRRFTARSVDFALVRTFNLDEFVGIAPYEPGSFRQFMHRHLFAGVNIQPEHIHFLRGDAADLELECRRYEADIRSAGGIDLQILGIGANGHVGFNEPAAALLSTTHRVTLAEGTRRANAALFDGDPERVPRQALTMGMGTILRARRLLLAATGESKARCIEETVNGAVTTRLPASFLQLHGDVELLLDAPAASRL